MSLASYDLISCFCVVPHTVREFGVEARKDGKAWELAFNGPIQPLNPETSSFGVVVRLARVKDQITHELYSTNLLFYLLPSQMTGMLNVYDLVRKVPFSRVVAVPTTEPLPESYQANPEGVIMEDIRITPIGDLWWMTGQGYRGKIMVGDGFVHDVGVYGAVIDPQALAPRLELHPLFGGIAAGPYKNSVIIPSPPGQNWIGARSMFQTKHLHYFAGVLDGWSFQGEIEGLSDCLNAELWDDVRRVGLGSNFIKCPELDGHVGFVHVVMDKNNPSKPRTSDPHHPGIEEQYEGWAVLLQNRDGKPVIAAAARALTPDSVPLCYKGKGELFTNKRVAFPMSLYRMGEMARVGYGWGDRALFEAEYQWSDLLESLSA